MSMCMCIKGTVIFIVASYIAVFDRLKARLSNKEKVPCFSRHIHPVSQHPSTLISKSDTDWMSSAMMVIVPTIKFLHHLQLQLLSIMLSLCFFTPPMGWCIEAPGPCSAVSINSDLAEAITFEHNYYRSMVDPVARNMMRMVNVIQSSLTVNCLLMSSVSCPFSYSYLSCCSIGVRKW